LFSANIEGSLMLAISGKVRIFLYQLPVDLRKGFEGLSTIIESVFQEEITNGAYFVFLNRPRDRMKVLYWDLDGLAIWYKRLAKGTFSKKNIEGGMIKRREFLMLLEGITPKSLQKRYEVT
jgi:transposase